MASGKLMGIAVGVVVGLLVVAVAGMALVAQKLSGKAAGLGEALAQVATEAGVESVDIHAAPEAAKQVQEAIQAIRLELAAAKDSLTASQTEASGAKAEVEAMGQRIQEQTTQAESLGKELEAAKASLASAQAAAETAAQGAQEAAQAAEKQIEELKQALDQAKEKMTEQIARLQAENEALRSAEQEPAALEGTGSEGTVLGGEALVPMSEMLSFPEEPKPEPEEGRVIGQSQMFSLLRYDGATQGLLLRLHDGQTLSYMSVPPDVVDRFVQSPDKLDMTYRFKIQGSFKSLPPDSVVIRKYWKWHRRHKAYADVRYVGPEEPVVSSLPEEEKDASGEAPAAE